MNSPHPHPEDVPMEIGAVLAWIKNYPCEDDDQRRRSDEVLRGLLTAIESERADAALREGRSDLSEFPPHLKR